MQHVVQRFGNRLLVCYPTPGHAGCGTVVTDYPLAARRAADQEALRLTLATQVKPEVPPEERAIPAGFYTDQGALF